MTDTAKSAEKATKTNKKSSTKSFKEDVLQVVDRIVQVAAALFFIATSYGFVSQWLETHQSQQELSVAGAIMVVAIALYLFTRRKR